MLACVCRPVSSSLPKGPPNGGNAPQKRTTAHYHQHHQQPSHHQQRQSVNDGGNVVTSEPRIATATIVKRKVNKSACDYMHGFLFQIFMILLHYFLDFSSYAFIKLFIFHS